MASEDQHLMDRTEDAVLSEEIPEASSPKKKTWQFVVPATDPWEEAAKEYYARENARKDDGSWGTWTEEQISIINKGYEDALTKYGIVIYDGEERTDVPVYDTPDEDTVTDEDQNATVVDPEDVAADDEQLEDNSAQDPSLPSSTQN